MEDSAFCKTYMGSSLQLFAELFQEHITHCVLIFVRNSNLFSNFGTLFEYFQVIIMPACNIAINTIQ